VYATEMSLQTAGGPNYVYEYDVTSSTPVLINSIPYQQINSTDFAVDESRARVYTTNGGQTNGAYGVEVSNPITGAFYTTLPLLGHPYGVSVTLLPGSSVVYGASGGGDATTVRYNQQDGTPLGFYSLGQSNPGGVVAHHELVITPNGALAYVLNNTTTFSFGIIGVTSTTLGITLSNLAQT